MLLLHLFSNRWGKYVVALSVVFCSVVFINQADAAKTVAQCVSEFSACTADPAKSSEQCTQEQVECEASAVSPSVYCFYFLGSTVSNKCVLQSPGQPLDVSDPDPCKMLSGNLKAGDAFFSNLYGAIELAADSSTQSVLNKGIDIPDVLKKCPLIGPKPKTTVVKAKSGTPKIKGFPVMTGDSSKGLVKFAGEVAKTNNFKSDIGIAIAAAIGGSNQSEKKKFESGAKKHLSTQLKNFCCTAPSGKDHYFCMPPTLDEAEVTKFTDTVFADHSKGTTPFSSTAAIKAMKETIKVKNDFQGYYTCSGNPLNKWAMQVVSCTDKSKPVLPQADNPSGPPMLMLGAVCKEPTYYCGCTDDKAKCIDTIYLNETKEEGLPKCKEDIKKQVAGTWSCFKATDAQLSKNGSQAQSCMVFQTKPTTESSKSKAASKKKTPKFECGDGTSKKVDISPDYPDKRVLLHTICNACNTPTVKLKEGVRKCVKEVDLKDIVAFPNPVESAGITSPQTFIGNLIKTFLRIVGSIALALVVYGGFVWMSSAGSPERVETGRVTVTWAAFGLAAVFASYVFVSYIFTALG